MTLRQIIVGACLVAALIAGGREILPHIHLGGINAQSGETSFGFNPNASKSVFAAFNPAERADIYFDECKGIPQWEFCGDALGDGSKIAFITRFNEGVHAGKVGVNNGIDIIIKGPPKATVDKPVYSTIGGKVDVILPNEHIGGNAVIVTAVGEDGKTRQEYVGHLNSFGKGIEDGSEVVRGRILGYAGATGEATGPHVHNSNLIDGVCVDPSAQPGFMSPVRFRSQNTAPASADQAPAQREKLKPLVNITVEEGLFPGRDDEVKNNVLDALLYVTQRFETTPAAPMNVRIIRDGGSPCGVHGEAITEGVYDPNSSARTLNTFTCDGEPLEHAVNIAAHEFVHQLQSDRYHQVLIDGVLLEGEATWGAGKYWLGGADSFKNFIKSYKNGKWMTENEGEFFGPVNHNDFNNMNQQYYRWASWCEFLVDKYGREKLDEASTTVASNNETDYGKVYGKDRSTLFKEWVEWMKSDATSSSGIPPVSLALASIYFESNETTKSRRSRRERRREKKRRN